MQAVVELQDSFDKLVPDSALEYLITCNKCQMLGQFVFQVPFYILYSHELECNNHLSVLIKPSNVYTIVAHAKV